MVCAVLISHSITGVSLPVGDGRFQDNAVAVGGGEVWLWDICCIG
jgi:hypothetical protein